MVVARAETVRAAVRVSVAARGLATLEAGAHGRVDAVYRSAINVSTPGGLLTIASPSAGGLPNGVLVDLGPDHRTRGIEPGMTVDAEDGALRIPAAAITIPWTKAVRWSPRLQEPSGGARGAVSRWRRRSGTVRRIARGLGPERGFGPLLWPARSAESAMLERARGTLAALTAALRDGDRMAAAYPARRLIGLGEGLTPSGDDVLVGIEAALHAVDSPVAGFLGGALVDVDERTTPVSAAYLRHAAAGEFAELLHDLLAVLLGEHARAATIERAIEQTIACGATSGSDGLIGVLDGLDAVAGIGRAMREAAA
jgi:hypothetical protein